MDIYNYYEAITRLSENIIHVPDDLDDIEKDDCCDNDATH